MALEKITSFSKPVSALADRPRISAADLKAWFDSNTTNEVKTCINNMIDALQATSGAGEIGANVEGIAQQTVLGVLTALKTLVDDRYTIAQIDTKLGTKFDTANAQDLVKTVNVDTTTGIITVTKYDGTQQTWDTAIEKVALDVELDGTEFVLTLADGTQQRVELSAFIDTYNFISSETIAATTSGEGNNKSVKFDLRPGSVTTTMMDPELLSTIQGFVDSASASATNASNSAAAALSSQNAAKSSQDAAFLSEQNAGQSEENAYEYMLAAQQSASNASSSASDADAAADRAEDAAARAESIAGGDYLVKADIVNDLTSGGIAKVLSAEQGKKLNQNKVNKTDIINDLTTGGSEKALSAEQGKQLNNTKAPLTSPAFIGTPTTPDLTAESAEGQITNKKYVDSELVNIESDLSQDIGEVAQGLLDLESSMNTLNQNVANKINRTDTKTFFLEPSKWVDGKYTLDVIGFGWTANTIIQINAPLPESNAELASGISIASQSNTQVVLQIESAPTEPVILTLLYGGEETTGYYVVDEIGTQTITWVTEEEQTDESIIFIANPDLATENLKDIHTNNLTFQCPSAYTEVVADSLLRFGGYAFHSEGNGYAYTNLASTNFDLSQPWLVHFYVNFKSSEGTSGSSVSTFLGFGTSNYNCDLLKLQYRNAQVYSNPHIKWQLQLNGDTIGDSIDESDKVKTDTYSQYQLLYNGTNLRLLKNKINVWSEIASWQISLSNQSCYFAVGPRSSNNQTHIRLGTVLLRQSNELPEIVTRSDWENKECWSSTHLVEVEKTQEIQVTEKAWYNTRSDGLYKWSDVPITNYELDENTNLLIHGNDLVPLKYSGTATVTNNGVTVSTDEQISTDGSWYFDGSSYMIIENAGTDETTLAGNFTVEWWEYITQNFKTGSALMNVGYDADTLGGILIKYDGTSLYSSSANTGSWDILNGAQAFDTELNKWIHWALVRNGDTWTTYKNGKQFWTGTASSTPWSSNKLVLQKYNTVLGAAPSYIDELRISNIARYTSDFEVTPKGWVKQESEVQ